VTRTTVTSCEPSPCSGLHRPTPMSFWDRELTKGWDGWDPRNLLQHQSVVRTRGYRFAEIADRASTRGRRRNARMRSSTEYQLA
jgi:hypothetical protein